MGAVASAAPSEFEVLLCGERQLPLMAKRTQGSQIGAKVLLRKANPIQLLVNYTT